MTFYRLEYKNSNFICLATVCCPLSMSLYHCYHLRKTNEPNNTQYMQRKELLKFINDEDEAYIVNGESYKAVKHQRINRIL